MHFFPDLILFKALRTYKIFNTERNLDTDRRKLSEGNSAFLCHMPQKIYFSNSVFLELDVERLGDVSWE